MASKISLPNSVKGEYKALYMILVADGKISKLEVAEDFIGSCTNELDSLQLAMGFQLHKLYMKQLVQMVLVFLKIS